MKAFEIQGGFGIDHLVLVDRKDPVPGPGQVLLGVRAVSLNARDVLFVEGFYYPRQKLPVIPCSDAACEVLEVGRGVQGLAPGDRVMPAFAQKWLAGPPTRDKLKSTLGGPFDGTLCERMVLDASALTRIPEHLSYEEASTLPCAGVTAWSALVDHGHLKAGETVVIQGTGGVSIFALQIAALHGARAIVTSRSEEKLNRARKLGAFATLQTESTKDWDRRVKELTGNVGADHVIDVGGAGTLEKSVRAVRIGGTVYVIGVLGGAMLDFPLLPVLMQQLRLQGIIVGSREQLDSFCKAVEFAGLRPVVDRVVEWTHAPAVMAEMKEGRHFGKLVLRLS